MVLHKISGELIDWGVKRARHGEGPGLGDPLFQVLGLSQNLQMVKSTSIDV